MVLPKETEEEITPDTASDTSPSAVTSSFIISKQGTIANAEPSPT
jgi:hypothetical protein